jgi:hypothetical protein
MKGNPQKFIRCLARRGGTERTTQRSRRNGAWPTTHIRYGFGFASCGVFFSATTWRVGRRVSARRARRGPADGRQGFPFRNEAGACAWRLR